MVATTVKPECANNTAVLNPTPDDVPVTSAIRFILFLRKKVLHYQPVINKFGSDRTQLFSLPP
ncbi:hypothetical protein [Coleofasciculus sp. H7-2]|uniref:hypothetical protein n=1 Tax=Coleofasciculus sp. H7-2 TaxID=3351545 RepID=UPI00366F65FD